MYLIDTNIYLEILLGQACKEECKDFLSDNANNLYLSDFSLHSIGVILFRYDKKAEFQEFYNDIYPTVKIITLNYYNSLFNNSLKYKLDFDDLYQYCVAKENGLKIVTMDRDFKKVDDIDVLFIRRYS